MNKLGRHIALAVGGAALLYLILTIVYTDGHAVLSGLLTFPLSMLALGLFLAALNYGFRFLRWHFYLRLLKVDVPLYESALTFVSGFALTVTPGKIGELLKSYLLRESYSAPIVLAERLTDLVSLLLLSLLGMSAWMTREQRFFVGIGFGLCAILLLGLSWQRLAHRVLDLMDGMPPRRISTALVPRLRTFYDAAYAILRPWPLFVAVVLSTAAWFSECLAFEYVMRGVGTPVPLLLCIFIYSLMTVAGALAFVPGGLGITEGGMALLLGKLGGVARPQAVTATLITRVLTLWFAVLLGVLALVVYGRRQRVALDLDALKREKRDAS
jgi:uncharacterized protein (TIRG00374 family)